jgi:phosphate transport system permease protein
VSAAADWEATAYLRRRHGQVLTEASRRSRVARQVRGRLFWALAALGMAASLFPLLDIVELVAVHGARALSATIFTQVTNGVSGGLQNAILGTVFLVALGLAVAAPIGVGAGVYVAEWSDARTAAVLNYLTDVLVGVPSIVVGYFGFIVFVGDFGWGFSWLAGSLALAVIMLPYIVRATELALSKVPLDLREGSLALGVTRARTVHAVSLPFALPGILTGVLLAMGIGIGETAPLLYTASWSNYNPSLALTHSPVGYLTYVVWTFIQEPFSTAHSLAYAAALLLMAGVLAINLVARQWLGRRQGEHAA